VARTRRTISRFLSVRRRVFRDDRNPSRTRLESRPSRGRKIADVRRRLILSRPFSASR
jgi:hypothetical protein